MKKNTIYKKSLNCPNCGADLDFAPGTATTECPYCKSDIFVGPLADRNKLSAMQQELLRNENALQKAERLKKCHIFLKKWRRGFIFFLFILFILNTAAWTLIGGANEEDESAIGVGSMTIVILAMLCFVVPAIMAAVYPCYDIEQDMDTNVAGKRLSVFFILVGIEIAVFILSMIAAFFISEYIIG